jgi:hypothetical protein
MSVALEMMAGVKVEQGDAVEAVRLLAVADRLRQDIGLPRTASEGRLYYNRVRQLTGEAVEQRAWDSAWAAGNKLSLDEAIAIVLAH